MLVNEKNTLTDSLNNKIHELSITIKDLNNKVFNQSADYENKIANFTKEYSDKIS